MIDLTDLGPLYHNFQLLGASNRQLPGIYELNQCSKAPIVLGYILSAIAKSRGKNTDPVSFAELFCADGFYAMFASRFGATRSVGIDDYSQGFTTVGPTIAARLGLSVEFRKQDALAVTEEFS